MKRKVEQEKLFFANQIVSFRLINKKKVVTKVSNIK